MLTGIEINRANSGGCFFVSQNETDESGGGSLTHKDRQLSGLFAGQ